MPPDRAGPAREIGKSRDMRGPRRFPELSLPLARLATRQHGVVERDQLLRLGMSADMIERWIRVGRLHRIHRGVYAVGHRALSREGRYLAPVLACGDGAVLSHAAAADLWELRTSGSRKVDVT